MKTISSALAIFGLVIWLFLAPCLIQAQKPKAEIVTTKVDSKTISSSTISALELKVFELINIKRRANGLIPLVWNKQIAAMARLYSESMAINNFFGHSGLDGKNIDERADDFRLGKWKIIGENIAYSRGYLLMVERTTESWMKSLGHRKNLLNKQWKETGVGIAVRNDGTYFFTQIFLLRK